MARRLLEKLLPSRTRNWLRNYVHQRKKARISKLTPLSEQDFRSLLRERMGLRPGDVALVHSSTDYLRLAFSSFRLLDLLLETVGEQGTLLFPTYPKYPSAEFLQRGEVFDVRKTGSYTGLLTELARRHPTAVRSLHPTKSVCAIGPLAEELTAEHPKSPYPYGAASPYYKLVPHHGKIIGLGVTTERLSFAHCADDALGEDFPVMPYHPAPFRGSCIDRNGNPVVVETYAHDLTKMCHNVPRYVRRHIAPELCEDFMLGGMQFYLAYAEPLFQRMIELARQGVTIYPRSVYKR
jgi:aminoglycoside 3-N-acetyltransferase